MIAALLLLVMLPGLLAIALFVKLTSPGPVLFKQRRYGYNNQFFDIDKFRTMHLSQEDGSGVKQTRPDDPRITPIGRFLRRSSLDELPQLLSERGYVSCNDLKYIESWSHALDFKILAKTAQRESLSGTGICPRLPK